MRPAGRLAQLEPVAGPVQPPHFPLMWASEPTNSHVLFAEALHQVMTATGFSERYWNLAISFPEPAASAVSTALTIQRLIMGERLTAIREAGARNAAEGRLRSVLAVCERP